MYKMLVALYILILYTLLGCTVDDLGIVDTTPDERFFLKFFFYIYNNLANGKDT